MVHQMGATCRIQRCVTFIMRKPDNPTHTRLICSTEIRSIPAALAGRWPKRRSSPTVLTRPSTSSPTTVLSHHSSPPFIPTVLPPFRLRVPHHRERTMLRNQGHPNPNKQYSTTALAASSSLLMVTTIRQHSVMIQMPRIPHSHRVST